ncbi:MAG: hypothetical protein QM758_02875 [Armatimonas sp.]
MRYHLTILEPLPGHKIAAPAAINVHGRIVGYSQKDKDKESISVTWISGKPHKISPDLGQPIDINDKNEILSSSCIQLPSGKQLPLNPEVPRYEPTAINNKSRVSGTNVNFNHEWAASHYSNEEWKGLELFEWEGSDAKDINDEGVIAGWYAGEKSGWSEGDACIWVNGHRRLLGCLPTRDSGHALSINNHMQVVGFCYEAAQHVRHGKMRWRAFFWHKGRIRDLGALKANAESCARHINDQSTIVGWSNYLRPVKNELGPGSPSYAVVWHQFKIIDLNTLVKLPPHFHMDMAFGINNRNQIIGTLLGPKGASKGFLLTPY